MQRYIKVNRPVTERRRKGSVCSLFGIGKILSLSRFNSDLAEKASVIWTPFENERTFVCGAMNLYSIGVGVPWRNIRRLRDRDVRVTLEGVTKRVSVFWQKRESGPRRDGGARRPEKTKAVGPWLRRGPASD